MNLSMNIAAGRCGKLSEEKAIVVFHNTELKLLFVLVRSK